MAYQAEIEWQIQLDDLQAAMDVMGPLLTVIDVNFWYNRHLGNDASDQFASEWIGNEWSKLLANTKSLQNTTHM